jgi:hypothetical protein
VKVTTKIKNIIIIVMRRGKKNPTLYSMPRVVGKEK